MFFNLKCLNDEEFLDIKLNLVLAIWISMGYNRLFLIFFPTG